MAKARFGFWTLTTATLILFACHSPTTPSQTPQLQVVEINGDLTLSGDEERVYESVELRIKGNIHIRNQAHLKLVNSRMVWEQSYHQQYWLYTYDESHLTLKNVYVESKDFYWLNWNFRNQSVIDFDNLDYNILWTNSSDYVNYKATNSRVEMTMSGWSDLHGSKIEVRDSRVYFEMAPPPETGAYTLTLPPKGHVASHHFSFLGDVKI